jgi:hypothetical protein
MENVDAIGSGHGPADSFGAAHFWAAVVLSACSQGNVDPAGYDPQLFCFLY